MKYAKGFTLLIVLVFMQVFALLALNSLSQAAMFTKAAVHEFQADNLLQSAEKLLVQLDKGHLVSCEVTAMSAFSLANKTVAWWQTHACQKKVAKRSYYYIWEELGEETCCLVKEKLSTVVFYRLSLFATERHAEVLLQSAIAVPIAKPIHCKMQPYRITPGRQSLRTIK